MVRTLRSTSVCCMTIFSSSGISPEPIGQGSYGRHDPGMPASGGIAVHDQRCLYENGDIVVEHSIMDFPDGTREAVMAVHMLKDGKIIRTETGATPIAK